MSGPSHNKVVVCYISSWAVYRQGDAKFEIENFDPSLCTHAIYCFAGLDAASGTIKTLDPWQDLSDDGGKDGYKRLTNLKRRYSHLKVSIAIGGWNEGSDKYSRMAANSESRNRFITSVLDFLRKYNFDGLDLDWEYPAKRGGSAADKNNFTQLVQELRAAFNRYNYLLTAALGAGKDVIDTSYNVAALSKHLNFIHIMSYDFHGPWDGRTGANAPLTSHDTSSVEHCINYMISLGASPQKLVMGIPFYGRTFFSNTSTGQRSLGEAAQAGWTNDNGFIGYSEICKELPKGYTRYWDMESKTPFAVSGNKVIVYDDMESITEKVKFAMQKGIIGCMVWSVDTDDFHAGYPLMKTINKAIRTYARH